MNSDFFKMTLIQGNMEKNANMSPAMKGIAALLLFTVFLCSRKGELLALYADIPITIVIFLLDCFFVKKAAAYRRQLSEMNGAAPAGPAPKAALPLVFYSAVLALILLGLALFK